MDEQYIPAVPQRSFSDRIKQALAQLAVAFTAILKFGGGLLPILLKTGGTMFFTIFIYSRIWGWRYAVGVVVLIFIHETGHLIAARMMGLRVGWPVFIPFMGALIALKEAPRNAWVEAVVGIGGPILGSIGALGAWAMYVATGHVLYLALAYVGFFLNLFNLIPIIPLDGGRIVSAISPWLWLLGLVLLVPVLLKSANVLLIIILVFLLINSLPRIVALFRKRTDVEQRYFECTPSQRLLIAFLYFALLIGLGLAMYRIEPLLSSPHEAHDNTSDVFNGTDSQ